MLTCHIEGLGMPNNTHIESNLVDKYVEFQRTVPKSIVHQAKLQRFFGYKASGGVDCSETNTSACSPMHLFYPPNILPYIGYSSEAGRNVLLTAVATPYKSYAGKQINGDY